MPPLVLILIFVEYSPFFVRKYLKYSGGQINIQTKVKNTPNLNLLVYLFKFRLNNSRLFLTNSVHIETDEFL